jgi:hypothetical protein
MDTADRPARGMGVRTGTKRSRRLLAGVSLTLLTSAFTLGGAVTTAQASAPASQSAVYEFLGNGEIHPQGADGYCLSSFGGRYDVVLQAAKCGLKGYLDKWAGSMVCTKVGSKEVCTGQLYILSANGANPTGGAAGVYGPSSPHYKDSKNDVILCPPDESPSVCNSLLSFIHTGSPGTADQFWVPTRNNAAIIWERAGVNGKHDAEDVELGKEDKNYGAEWTHPAWEKESD